MTGSHDGLRGWRGRHTFVDGRRASAARPYRIGPRNHDGEPHPGGWDNGVAEKRREIRA